MDKPEIRAVELVRSIRDKFYEDTKHMSPEELKEFIIREAARVIEAESREHSSSKSAA